MRNLASPRVIKEILSEYEFRFSKSLGQNFLVDEGALAGILSGADISEDDCVLKSAPASARLHSAFAVRRKKSYALKSTKRLSPFLRKI